jgi:glycopeptide antibiotics resistance protein
MKKFLPIFYIIVLAAMSFGVNSAQGQDLCGGTNGNGQIVSVGNNEFTLKRHSSGNNQIIHLSDQTTIETLMGLITLSDLKIGDRVTLVGGPNSDGSFTADTVVVCAASLSGSEDTQSEPNIVRDSNILNRTRSLINLSTILFFALIWIAIVTFLRLKKRKSLVFLLFFTIFYVYLFKVLDYTLLQFQSLLLLKHFVPDLMLRGAETGKSVNLIPLMTLRLEDVRTSLLNVLMMVPFGFGLPFITNFRMKKVVVAGLFLSIGIEFLQLLTGFTSNTTFRVADINDLIFNSVGAAIGYILFIGFVRTYWHISRNWKNPILRYIAERPQIDK